LDGRKDEFEERRRGTSGISQPMRSVERDHVISAITALLT
jgi:hypothetical protein